MLIGGNGPMRTLPLAAEYADEWNAVFCNIDLYRERSKQLDEMAKAKGRDPADIKRSLMTAVRWCEDDAAVDRLLTQTGRRLGRTATIRDITAMGPLAGTSAMVIEQIREFEAAGCARMMLQVPDYDDMSPLARWADEIVAEVGAGDG